MDLIGIGLLQTEATGCAVNSQFMALFFNLEVLGRELLHAKAQPSFTGS